MDEWMYIIVCDLDVSYMSSNSHVSAQFMITVGRLVLGTVYSCSHSHVNTKKVLVEELPRMMSLSTHTQ